MLPKNQKAKDEITKTDGKLTQSPKIKPITSIADKKSPGTWGTI